MKLHTLLIALSLAAASPLYAADDTGAPMSSGTSSPGSTMESPSGTSGGAMGSGTSGSSANGGYGAGDAASRDAALQAYEAAKEDCRKLSTGAQADCLADAAAAYSATQGASPSGTPATEQSGTANPGTAMDPVGSTGADPRAFEEAKAKCDTLTEERRDVCLNDLKSQYPQQ